jgi:hypothetical protein
VPSRVSPTERIRADIDALFGSGRDLVEIVEDVARLGARLLIQTAVEAEVDEFLGRTRYERRAAVPDARAGSRNGFCPTTVKTTTGTVTVARPKLRGTDDKFVSRLFGTGVTKTNALETLVIAGFVRGLSVRDVEAALAEALGRQATLSKSTVSRVCQAIADEFNTWRERRLDELELDYLFLDASHFKMRHGSGAEPVLAAWGITTAGKPILVGLDAARRGEQRRLGRLPRRTQTAWPAPTAAGHLRRRWRPGRRDRTRLHPLVAAAVSDPPRSQHPGQGARRRPGRGQASILGHLRHARRHQARPGG